MNDIPADLKFLPSHDGLELNQMAPLPSVLVTCARSLGDIVFVELPEVGQSVDAESDAAIVESVKAAQMCTRRFLAR